MLYVMDLDQSQQGACKVKVSRDLRDVTFSMPGTLHTHAWKEAHVFVRFGLAPNDLLSLGRFSKKRVLTVVSLCIGDKACVPVYLWIRYYTV